MDRKSEQPPGTADTEDSHTVGELIRAAGRREQPPLESYEQVRSAAEAAFRSAVGQRKQRRMNFALAASVGLAALLIVALISNRTGPLPTQVAQIRMLVGSVTLRADEQSAWTQLLPVHRELTRGVQLKTGPESRIALELSNGVSLRVDKASLVELASGSNIRLLAGTLYIDSGRDRKTTQPVRILTRAGTVSDIGTQFEVRYLDEALRLRIREGRVILEQGERRIDGAAGQQVLIGTQGTVVRAQIASDDPEWGWVQSVAPAPDIDGQPLTALLDWVSRETGRKIQFTSPDLEARADDTILHGSIEHLSPLEALVTMLATTDLEFSLDEPGVITISDRR